MRLAHHNLHDKSGPGSDYMGWVEHPQAYDRDEFVRIKQVAQGIRSKADALVVIGIGGSYLGARAAIDMLGGPFGNRGTQVYFAGHNLSPAYHTRLLEHLADKSVAVNVISKSGTTTEPAIAFRIIREWMEQRYGPAEAAQRIVATTDARRGALRQVATEKGYQRFVIPDDIGGRYSVLTAVGLLPMAVAGIDLDAVMAGYAAAYAELMQPELEANPSYQYAAVRNTLYRKGRAIELLVSYEPALHSFGQWWQQLFGESEGKDHKGIFPATADFTTELHSLGQYIQEGRRHLFETTLAVDKPACDITLKPEQDDSDGLNFLAGRTMSFVNEMAFAGTVLAHTDGGVPNLVVRVPELTPYHLGALVYFFFKACGVSGQLLGVNPFDQPGVEAYKRNMFALLGKPGFEQQREALQQRLSRS